MKKIPTLLLLSLVSLSAYSKDNQLLKSNFIDAKGQSIHCSINGSNVNCKNNSGMFVICGYSDKGYICSSDE